LDIFEIIYRWPKEYLLRKSNRKLH